MTWRREWTCTKDRGGGQLWGFLATHFIRAQYPWQTATAGASQSHRHQEEGKSASQDPWKRWLGSAQAWCMYACVCTRVCAHWSTCLLRKCWMPGTSGSHNPSYSGGRDQEDRQSRQKVPKTLSWKYPSQNRAGRMAQMVECLPGNSTSPEFKPQYAKKPKIFWVG
jgi:hypothetical protein